MDLREREEFDLAVELAKNKQSQAAYFIFSRLREKYPQDNRVRVLAAIFSPEFIESRIVFEMAMRLDPTDPVMAQAIEWLEKRPSTNATSRSYSPGPTQLQTLEKPALALRPTNAIPTLNLAGEFAPPVDDIIKTLTAPETEVETETVKPEPAKEPAKTKPFVAPFSLVWCLRLACSLVFFGSALCLLFLFVTARNLNETEKAYAEGVSRLAQKTGAVNSQLQAAITDFNAGKLDRAGLEKQLQDVIGLNDELRQLKSPSARFDKLDGLLGEAYSYFNDGATGLINGLEFGSVEQFNEGYRLFGLGNDYLRQARDELKALGG